jgi:hypothetical protein
MKKLTAILCLIALAIATSGYSQGLINFFNNVNTLVSAGPSGNSTAISTSPESYYFGLLTSAVGANQFTFSGVYGTNQSASAGRFTGGANVTVSGWAPGTARDFEVAGWSSSLGPTFNPAWLVTHPGGQNDFFGVSSLGNGIAGGFDGTGTLPTTGIFGGATGIQTGFNLTPGAVPEPSSLRLASLATVALLLLRRRLHAAT